MGLTWKTGGGRSSTGIPFAVAPANAMRKVAAWLRQRPLCLTLVAAAVVHLGAFFYAEEVPEVRFTADSYEYLQAGKNLFELGVFYSGNLNDSIDPLLYSRRPPAYPVLLELVRRMTGQADRVALIQIALTLVVACLIWQILTLLQVAGWKRTAATMLYLLWPAQIIYTQTLMAEILLQFSLVLAVYGVLNFLVTRKVSGLALANLALALAVLAKPVMLFFWVPNLLFHGSIYLRTRRKTAILLSLIPPAIVAGWSYRNHKVTGYFHYSSIQTSQMLLHSRESRNAAGGIQDFTEKSRQTRQTYFRALLKNWPRTLQRFSRGILFFFTDPGRFDLFQFFDWPTQVTSREIIAQGAANVPANLSRLSTPVVLYLSAVLLLNVVILAGFLTYLIVGAGRIPGFKLFLCLLILYVALITGPIGASRYRLPVEPLLLITLSLASFARVSHHAPDLKLRPQRTRSSHRGTQRVDADKRGLEPAALKLERVSHRGHRVRTEGHRGSMPTREGWIRPSG